LDKTAAYVSETAFKRTRRAGEQFRPE
jgi:hypothetical protein